MTDAKPDSSPETKPVGPGDQVILVDGSSFIFRAYFQSIRQDARYNYRSDKLPTGAVRLFCNKLFQFVRDGAAGVMPTHLAIIFDKSVLSACFKVWEYRYAGLQRTGRRRGLKDT